jgi:hypothetical protein
MDTLTKEKWNKFLQGHWQREKPLVEGLYPLATLDGDLTSDKGIIYKDPETGNMKSVRTWGGFWWSEPVPDLPAVPEELLRSRK